MPPQDLPFLHTLRRARTLMRATAVGVGMAFSLLILAPTATAVRAEATRAPQGAGLTPSDEAAFGATLGQLERRLGRFEAALAERRDSATEAQALRRLGRELERLDRRLEANFAAVEAQLAAQALPTLILERHRAMRSHYRQEIERLFDELQALEEASDAPTRHERAQRLRAYLKAHPGWRAQQPFDPEDLPNRTLRPRPEHKPRLERRQFRAAGLHDHPRVRLAALGDFRFDGLPGADDPAYLAPSDEVTRSAAIAAQAAALAHDPVRIYHWVRNHIEWLPTWGA